MAAAIRREEGEEAAMVGWHEVLDFWFGTLSDFDDYPSTHNLWFIKSDVTDRIIGERFGDLLDHAMAGGLKEWEQTARSRLALIIVLDQFSRNIYRGAARAFRADTRAYQVAVEGIDRGMDQQLKLIERVFFYMPLEHAESMDAQERSMAAFGRLADDATESFRSHAASFLDYAQRHRDVIARFGRYPHRNQILGRESTPEELEFLSMPGSSF